MSNEIEEIVIKETQKLLGKYVKKPVLTEKLLRKPPFRFLHDTINSVIRETGFLKGLYTERELVSENVKNKDDKVAFLSKLIDAIKTITGTELAVRPNKVIAGLEPTQTNLLLQAIGTAINNNLDSAQYVAQIKMGKKPKVRANSQENDKTKKGSKIREKNLVNSNRKEEKTKLASNTPRTKKQLNENAAKTSEKKSTRTSSRESKDGKSTKAPSKKKKEESVTPREEIIKEKAEEVVLVENNVPEEPNIPNGAPESITEIETVAKPSENIKDLIENSITGQLHEEEEAITSKNAKIERIKSAKPRNLNLIVPSASENTTEEASGSQEKPLEQEKTNNLRPKSSLRPPSVRPSSARPGAPRLRTDIMLPEGELMPLGKVNVILENYTNKDVDEEETVTIQTVSEPEYQAPPVLQLPADKGHLVEQILEQINQDDVMEHAKPTTVNIEWEENGLRSRNAMNKEIEQLKSAIQTLTRTANPLGKLVNYLHEDIDAMHSEMDMWVNLARHTLTEIANQKRISKESNRPLQLQLEEVEQNIGKLQEQIRTVYGNILHNESRIRNLLE